MHDGKVMRRWRAMEAGAGAPVWRMAAAWGAALCAAVVASLSAPTPARAEPQLLQDEEMADVAGRDGVGFAVHLEMNSDLLQGIDVGSRLTAGFDVHGIKTYLVAHNIGGIVDLFAMTLNVRRRADGSDYLDLGLPFFVGVGQFGYRALGAQTDPTAPIANSYGQLLLDGHASMRGHLYLWAQ
ncbi:MAG: hypothetical protein QM742_11310 [Aquabacterium sp.]